VSVEERLCGVLGKRSEIGLGDAALSNISHGSLDHAVQ
jgi:hypothetical protein